MKVIAFSLWGDNTRYTLGALQNASLAKIVYPDWMCRFYVARSVPQYIISLLSEFDNVQIINMEKDSEDDTDWDPPCEKFVRGRNLSGETLRWEGMFWRFEAASDPDVEILLVRDCDSRLWFREKEAVDEWLESDADFHIMRDHEYHNTSILGGMWGCRGERFRQMKEWVTDYRNKAGWNYTEGYWPDQNFLTVYLYPLVKDTAKVHDEFFDKKPYPTPRDEKHFVGQAYAGTGRILDQEEYFQTFMKREYDAQK